MKKLKFLTGIMVFQMTDGDEIATDSRNEYILHDDYIRKDPSSEADPLFIQVVSPNKPVITFVRSEASSIGSECGSARIWHKTNKLKE